MHTHCTHNAPTLHPHIYHFTVESNLLDDLEPNADGLGHQGRKVKIDGDLEVNLKAIFP